MNGGGGGIGARLLFLMVMEHYSNDMDFSCSYRTLLSSLPLLPPEEEPQENFVKISC